jgi:D-glycero-D-manno-heptose 1,7-bisphosphate phosphatase
MPAVLLDREGVIVVREPRDPCSFAPRRLAEYRLYPETLASLQRLKGASFPQAVVTNQPGVEDSSAPRPEVDAKQKIIWHELPVDVFKVCFHRQVDGWACRKRKPGMALEAAKDLGIGLVRNDMIENREGDVGAGCAAGCTTVFNGVGYDEPAPGTPERALRSIAGAADVIIGAALTIQETS